MGARVPPLAAVCVPTPTPHPFLRERPSHLPTARRPPPQSRPALLLDEELLLLLERWLSMECLAAASSAAAAVDAEDWGERPRRRKRASTLLRGGWAAALVLVDVDDDVVVVVWRVWRQEAQTCLQRCAERVYVGDMAGGGGRAGCMRDGRRSVVETDACCRRRLFFLLLLSCDIEGSLEPSRSFARDLFRCWIVCNMCVLLYVDVGCGLGRRVRRNEVAGLW